MKLLVSPVDPEETKQAIEGGADIIDIKNPSEGSLGASYPWVIQGVKKLLRPGLELSATMGDLDYRPGFASLSARGLSNLEVDYIKAGLKVGLKKYAAKLACAVVKASAGNGSKIVLAGYADHAEIGSIHPLELPGIAISSGARGVMIDTFEKNGKTIFDHMETEEIREFIQGARAKRLIVALAGQIGINDIPLLKELEPDVIGVRGAVCSGNDRRRGRIEREKVKEFRKILD